MRPGGRLKFSKAYMYINMAITSCTITNRPKSSEVLSLRLLFFLYDSIILSLRMVSVLNLNLAVSSLHSQLAFVRHIRAPPKCCLSYQ